MGGIRGGPADRLSADRPLEVRRTFGRHGSGYQSAFGRTSTTVDPCPMVGRVSVDVRSTVGQQTFGRWSTRCVAPKYTSSETLNYLWDFEKKSTPSASSSSQLSSEYRGPKCVVCFDVNLVPIEPSSSLVFESALPRFLTKPDDVWIASHPKSGEFGLIIKGLCERTR